MRQLPLNLPHDPAMGADDFLVTAANETAHALISRWPDWPAPRLLLHGPPGCGKTHLAAIWGRRAGAVRCDAGALNEGLVPELTAAGAVVVEVPGDPPSLPSEAALFHLINYAAECNAPLLVTARAPAGRWRVSLPDLCTRLHAMPSAAIAAPDDALLEAVLFKLFRDRQLDVSPAVLTFLVARMERSLDAARRLAAALDAASLADRRKITVPLAAKVLQRETGRS